MKTIYNYILIVGLFTVMTYGESIAQNAKKKTTRIQAEYIKDASRTEYLIVTLRVRDGRYAPLVNGIVQFYSVNDTSRVLLEKKPTNDEGKAIFTMNDYPQIYMDSTGLITFEVEYAGNSSNKSSSREISVRQAGLEISFFQKDSIKSIDINARQIGPGDKITPLKNKKISFFIEGTFSQLLFDEGKTDEEGRLRVEFPVYMPGDTSGMLTIVSKIIEDDIYGTIESKADINWAIPVPLAVEKRRGLGDTDAPLWMVYTLITLLSAVWFHYLYVIFLIVKIKLKGKSAKRKLSRQPEISLSNYK